jgi:hypothetical protein
MPPPQTEPGAEQSVGTKHSTQAPDEHRGKASEQISHAPPQCSSDDKMSTHALLHLACPDGQGSSCDEPPSAPLLPASSPPTLLAPPSSGSTIEGTPPSDSDPPPLKAAPPPSPLWPGSALDAFPPIESGSPPTACGGSKSRSTREQSVATLITATAAAQAKRPRGLIAQ